MGLAGGLGTVCFQRIFWLDESCVLPFLIHFKSAQAGSTHKGEQIRIDLWISLFGGDSRTEGVIREGRNVLQTRPSRNEFDCFNPLCGRTQDGSFSFAKWLIGATDDLDDVAR